MYACMYHLNEQFPLKTELNHIVGQSPFLKYFICFSCFLAASAPKWWDMLGYVRICLDMLGYVRYAGICKDIVGNAGTC